MESLTDFYRSIRQCLHTEINRPVKLGVTQATERALAAVDDPNRIVPWIDAGRAPHNGDPMSALTAGEWSVISGRCGQIWHPQQSDYRPTDRLVL